MLCNCCFRRLNHHVVDTDTPQLENINFGISYLKITGFDLANTESLIRHHLLISTKY